jgi:EmrB/QacA subfamily drug resistance transporter
MKRPRAPSRPRRLNKLLDPAIRPGEQIEQGETVSTVAIHNQSSAMTHTTSTLPGVDPRRWKALALLCTATFMVILDAQIVILALPSIERDLGFAPGAVQWVLSAYLISFGGLLLLGGRSADLMGRRRMFLVGTAMFLIASLGCGFATAPAMLIGARILQGVSAAVMSPTALSILMNTFEEGAERNRALGIWSAIGGVGATAALLIGGPLTDTLGWEWIFFLNVPVALALLWLGPRLLRESYGEVATRSYDPAGALTITGALISFIFAIVEAPRVGWLHGQTLLVGAGAAVLAVAFVVHESTAPAPLMPLRLFRSSRFVGGNLAMLFVGMSAFGMSLMVSSYAQKVLGFSAIVFGLGTAVMPVMAVVGSYAAQAAATRVGVRDTAAGAMLLVGVGSLLLGRVPVTGSYARDLFPGLLVFGPGLGAGAVAASIASLTGVAEAESGLASGVNSAAFQIGGALGVAIASTVALVYAVGPGSLESLTHGYRAGFDASAAFAALGLTTALALLRR